MPRPRLTRFALASIVILGAIDAHARQPAPAKPALPVTRDPYSIPPELLSRLGKIDAIRPIPVEIPEPPPHEGALVDIPYTVDAPDILRIESLAKLEDRPLGGEYLIRADGTISLSFYGSLHVRGLTLDQVKEKLILHLNKTMYASFLGMIPETRAELADYLVLPPLPDPVNIFGPVAIGAAKKDEPAAEPPKPMYLVPSAENLNISVEVLVHNSKVYYVDGDVGLAGRFPIQGNETVLDAIYNGGGLSPNADPKSITLYRPGRGGKPAREYPIELAKIKAGDAALNYQLFPGDRLIVGRNKVVEATVQIDRLAAPLNSLLNTWLTYAYTIRSVNSMPIPIGVTGPQPKSTPGDGVALPGSADASVDGVRREYIEMVKRLTNPEFREVTPRELGDAVTRPVRGTEEERPKK